MPPQQAVTCSRVLFAPPQTLHLVGRRYDYKDIRPEPSIVIASILQSQSANPGCWKSVYSESQVTNGGSLTGRYLSFRPQHTDTPLFDTCALSTRRDIRLETDVSGQCFALSYAHGPRGEQVVVIICWLESPLEMKHPWKWASFCELERRCTPCSSTGLRRQHYHHRLCCSCLRLPPLTCPAQRATRALLAAACLGCLLLLAGMRLSMDTMTLQVTRVKVIIGVACEISRGGCRPYHKPGRATHGDCHSSSHRNRTCEIPNPLFPPIPCKPWTRRSSVAGRNQQWTLRKFHSAVS